MISIPPDGLRVDEIVIRLPTHADVAAIAPAFADPAVGGEAGLPPLDEAALHVFIDEELEGLLASGTMVPLLLVDAETDEVLGGGAYHHVDSQRATVEIGYWLLPGARGRGVASRAVRALAEHAFAQKLRRIHAVVRVENSASQRVLERAGFTREGVMRSYLPYAGEWRDATLFSLLSDE